MTNSKRSKGQARGQSGRKGPRKGPPAKQRRYLVAGERAVAELLDHAPERVKALWVDKSREFPKLCEKASALGIEVALVRKERLEDEAGQGLARGVIAHAAPPPKLALDTFIQTHQDEPQTLLLALDAVTDPQNFGAILRNAEFFGTQGVMWGSDRAAPLSVLAVRASAGASERVPLIEVPKLTQALRELKDAGYWVVGSALDPGCVPWQDWLAQDPPSKIVLIMGNEHSGIRPSVRALCDHLVMLPRSGALGSLNVSAASAALLAVLRALSPGDRA